MGKDKTFKITVPNLSPSKPKSEKQKNSNIDEFKKSIKSQYDELMVFQDIGINNENREDLEKLILATEDLISNCMNDNIYSGNRDQYFVNLIFICHKLSLKMESFKIEEKINELNDKSEVLSENQLKLEKKQEEAEEKSNNLVYTILGFIASFSVISAAVSAIDKMNSIINIMLFMAFTAFITITTLIGLDNFYRAKNNKNQKLQNNYFLWRLLIFVMIMLIFSKGIIYLKNNDEKIFRYIGTGINNIVYSE